LFTIYPSHSDRSGIIFQDSSENDFQNQLLSISGRLAGVNEFLRERFCFPRLSLWDPATPTEKRASENAPRLISFVPLVYPRSAGVKTLAD
jgi:hypothetical protein